MLGLQGLHVQVLQASSVLASVQRQLGVVALIDDGSWWCRGEPGQPGNV